MTRALPLAGLLLGCAGLAALGGCSLSAADVEVQTLTVDAQTVECVGVAPQQCLRVKRDPEAAWELFYSDIEGFDHEPGFIYVIEVEVRTVLDPPADGSSRAYRLIRIVDKSPA